jgi:hypothetical protein
MVLGPSECGKDVRESAQAIKNDAAINVRSESRGVFRRAVERRPDATRRGLGRIVRRAPGCRRSRGGGDVGVRGRVCRRGWSVCRLFSGRNSGADGRWFAYCFHGGGCEGGGGGRQVHEHRIAAERDDRYPGQRHHGGSELVDLVGDSTLCRLLLLTLRDFQQTIISRTLLGIAENLVGTHDPAELGFRIRVCRIDIGMRPLGRATKRSPQVIGFIVRKRAEQIVKRLHRKALSVALHPTLTFRREFQEQQAEELAEEQALVVLRILFQQGRKMTVVRTRSCIC